MGVLALDLATHTGWAYREKDRLVSGVWDLSQAKDDSSGERLRRLWGRLHKTHLLGDVDLVVYEVPGRLHGHARRVLPGLQAVVELWCSIKGVECRLIGIKSIKKHATGNSKASKDDMVRAAHEKWPDQELDSHDQADALWLLDLAFHQWQEGEVL